jgi:hypothetical protein
MAALRNSVDVDQLLDDIEHGTAFATQDFFAASSGNLTDFLKLEYHCISQSLVNITAGGNGGMASIGRGEFFIAFMSNFDAMISKSGRGDIDYSTDKCEEVKHNGGKIKVDEKAGREVTKNFLELVEQQGVDLRSADYLPGRRKDADLYSESEKSVLNGLYWAATTGEQATPMAYDQWAAACIRRAAEKVFSVSDSLLVISAENEFVRFFDAQSVVDYYSQDLSAVEFELRARQANPVSIYAAVM